MTFNGVELYEKKGKVGVLVSEGFGAGWSTWNDQRLAYDKRAIEFWLAHKDDDKFMYEIDRFAETDAKKEASVFFESIGYEDVYFGGFNQIKLCFVDYGTPWIITEYDGHEELLTTDLPQYTTFAKEVEE